MSGKRGWWVGLRCHLCGERVKADNAKFSQPVNEDGTLGEPVAEHHAGDCEQEAGGGTGQGPLVEQEASEG